MPYIKQEWRAEIDQEVDELMERLHEVCNLSDVGFERAQHGTHPDPTKKLAGQITYAFYKILVRFYALERWYYKGDVYKILMSCLTEFQENHMKPYEKAKIEENGDVG